MATITERSLALDVFRGMTICFMIIINNPGAGAVPYGPITHAAWHGFTPADLVFPSFLFAVGTSMSFSMAKQIENSIFLKKVIKRTLIIFMLGFFLFWFPFVESDGAGGLRPMPFSSARIMGVLQRIALSYFFAALMVRFLSFRAVLILSAVLLTGYWLILLLFSAGGDPYGMLTNAATLVDKMVLGENHLYTGEGVPFDPEGILGTMPSIVHVIAGYYTGKYIRAKGNTYEVLTKLLLTGFLLFIIALFWNYFFPINKKIWSSSYVLLTIGLDMLIVPALIYILDVRKWHHAGWPKFFTIFGKNPLFIYVLSELIFILCYKIPVGTGDSFYIWINNVLYQPLLPGAAGSLLFALTVLSICWLTGLLLDRRKIYIKV